MEQREFHPATDLPERGQHLLIELADGSVIDGIRPLVDASHRTNPDWRDMKGNRLDAKEITRWAIK
ncbi:hypothetical protein [Marinobacterium stanieri]|uniref:Uncharacterized protein n=1 Tax=Marinobacterium stanieri TaxID=49186 RepID=A0A1N6QDC3_9GAMM|nr:hypothetical protein [Marinobacterium stanieri]SIQ14594.1 hypothetical protein SAMN05421647_102432 [Marinobacterium stanieri]